MASKTAHTRHEYADEAFVDAVRAGVVDSVAPTAAEVARRVGCSRTTATRRLDRLADRDVADRHTVGPVTLWTVAGESLMEALR